jgi:uncharacterized membrane-anchored protein
MSDARKMLLALGAVALAQTLALAWMVIERVWLIKTGREITLPIEPVDPRDLFRGEYVRLAYPIARVPLGAVEGGAVRRNAKVYVTLEKTADDAWKPVAVARWLRREDNNPSRIVLKARATWAPAPASSEGLAQAGADWRGSTVRYGIESYFVPQGQGRQLEAMAREKKLAVLVAVDWAGNAAIKGLIIDGKLQYEEPLF